MRRAFEALFRDLLRRFGARRIDQGIRWLFARAHQDSARQRSSLARALLDLQLNLEEHARTRGAPLRSAPQNTTPANQNVVEASSSPPRFFCDAGLGGLARWLRVAGYETFWKDGIGDADLLRQARTLSCIVLTTDSLLFERRALRDREIPALWLPPSLSIPDQLAAVFRCFRLERREARCMRCGGVLDPVDAQSVWNEIPPKTRLWLRDYFRCQQCHQLFWHGTHWRRIQQTLQRLASLYDRP